MDTTPQSSSSFSARAASFIKEHWLWLLSIIIVAWAIVDPKMVNYAKGFVVIGLIAHVISCAGGFVIVKSLMDGIADLELGVFSERTKEEMRKSLQNEEFKVKYAEALKYKDMTGFKKFIMNCRAFIFPILIFGAGMPILGVFYSITSILLICLGMAAMEKLQVYQKLLKSEG